MDFIFGSQTCITVIKSRRPFKSCILMGMSCRFKIPEELKRLFQLLNDILLLFRGEHIFMSLVTFLHRLDFVSLSLTLPVGFNCLVDPLFNDSSRDVVDSEHELESVSQGLFGLIFELLEFKEQDWHVLSLLNVEHILVKIFLPLGLLLHKELPKFGVLFSEIVVNLLEVAVHQAHVSHGDNHSERVSHEHDDFVHFEVLAGSNSGYWPMALDDPNRVVNDVLSDEG